MQKHIAVLAGVVLSVAVLSTGRVRAEENAVENDVAGVQAAADKFYEALNALFVGDGAPMLDVWSHQDDITYMGPMGGRCVGWEEVRAMWEEQAALNLGGQIHAEEMLITVSGPLAVTTCYEVGENLMDGKPVKVSIRATNVFRNEDGTWKMIGHHTDILPFLAK